MLVRLVAIGLLICALGVLAGASSNPVPMIGQPLHPDSVVPGTRGVTFTVSGTGFVPGSVVHLDKRSLFTTFVNSHTLRATVPPSALATPGGALVTVSNPTPGGGVSNAAPFEITKSTPSVFLFDKGAVTPATTNSLAEGDFNGDGKLDIAVSTGTTVTILLGNGDGSFTATTFPTTAQFVGTLVAGDFNGDGKQDLAFPDPFHNLLHVLLGNGDGTFTEASTTRVGGHPVWAAAGDFNGDGKLDLAVTNQAGGNVSILLGHGDGTFLLRSTVAVGAHPNALVVSDFDGDGKLDLAVVNSSSNTLSILLGNGNGTFSLKSSPTTGTSPYAVAAADFNNDGKMDLAVTNSCGNAPSCTAPGFASITVLLGTGDGTFTSSSVVMDGFGNPHGIAAADFNGDGRPDLVIAGLNESSGVILFGNGRGGFGGLIATPPNTRAQYVVTGDFNNDGRLDFVVNNSAAVQGGRYVVIAQQVPVAFYPAVLTFPPQPIGTTSAPKTATFANLGLVPVNISKVEVGRDFSGTNNCPATLEPGASCTVTVQFTPTFVGVTGGAVVVTDDALGITQYMSLVGTGK